jgi:hypothetical protein
VEEIANEQRHDLSELNALFVVGDEWRSPERKIPLFNPVNIGELERFEAAVSEFCKYLAAGVKNLRDTSQEHIGLVSRAKPPNQVSGNWKLQEFNLTSIREAQKSTSTSVSMKRLSWITVRIPATLEKIPLTGYMI